MEEVIVVLIGLGVVAAAPRVRILRPMAKVVLKTGMTVTEATVTVAAADHGAGQRSGGPCPRRSRQ